MPRAHHIFKSCHGMVAGELRSRFLEEPASQASPSSCGPVISPPCAKNSSQSSSPPPNLQNHPGGGISKLKTTNNIVLWGHKQAQGTMSSQREAVRHLHCPPKVTPAPSPHPPVSRHSPYAYARAVPSQSATWQKNG